MGAIRCMGGLKKLGGMVECQYLDFYLLSFTSLVLHTFPPYEFGISDLALCSETVLSAHTTVDIVDSVTIYLDQTPIFLWFFSGACIPEWKIAISAISSPRPLFNV